LYEVELFDQVGHDCLFVGVSGQLPRFALEEETEGWVYVRCGIAGEAPPDLAAATDAYARPLSLG